MIYRYMKKDGNVIRIGAVDAAELETKLQGYLDGGYEHATAEEHDEQILKGAANAGTSEEKTA